MRDGCVRVCVRVWVGVKITYVQGGGGVVRGEGKVGKCDDSGKSGCREEKRWGKRGDGENKDGMGSSCQTRRGVMIRGREREREGG